ncbi:L-ribulose-5-phosphate 3-epimerase [Treponema parvum]|uniref:L-ribulose-5-phosphate 3-epimerase n=1 Tax=Treponema parvum TaxID=138851 RepID=A0A975IBT1_9SPIR|nr:L-ribulose-5-phosphate 3-epimerase [Treponema parvum]QTQ11128.1 L-ribulose-5-phosphate 3-epimerase [Treponema parvum]QTQ16931.1 L-ribulose-5-phosphate 3-epimerase [Treponema parvum]
MKHKYALGMYEKAVPADLSWKEKLTAAKGAGYNFMEVSIDETDEKLSRLDMTKTELRRIIDAQFETELPIRSLCLSAHRKYPLGSNNPKIEAKSLEIMEKSLEFSAKIGVRVIMLAGYDVYYETSTEETVLRFGRNLEKCVEMASRSGIILAFETMETPFMNTTEKAMNYVNKINSAFLSVYPDIGNINNAAITYGNDVLEDLKKAKGHIVGLHLKETVPGKFRDMMYGQGIVDFPSAIKTAWEMGVRRYVTEFWYLGEADWKERLSFARKTMGNLLDIQEKRAT